MQPMPLADPVGPMPVTSLMESSEAGSLTYKTIVSSDQRIIAEIPAETVQPDQQFNLFVSVTPYIMTYQYGYAYGSTFHTVDYRWPWGSTNLNFPYPDISHSNSGKYEYEVRIIYCSSGAPVCGHGWLQTTLKWTVTVGDDICTIPGIPYFSQGDSRWGDDEYALPVPQNLFRTWGCAVTSSSMILRRFGINVGADGNLIYPGTMNAWLASHYGYETGSEALKWWVIDDYSKEAPGGTGQPKRIVYNKNRAVNIPDDECVYASSVGDMCATYSKIIDDYICDGIPVILRLTSLDSGLPHFVVAQNQGIVGDTRTLEILDPSDNSRSNLEPYTNRFIGFRIFEAATETTDPTSIIVYLGSPAHLQITDPTGNLTGWDLATGQVDRGIPDSNYLDEGVEGTEFWVGYIEHPVGGTYDIKVVGTGTGKFTLGVETYDQIGNRLVEEYVGEISAGREYNYLLPYHPEIGNPDGIVFNTYEFLGFGLPLDSNQLKVYKLNRTIPVKFTAVRNNGGAHDDIVARLSVQLMDNAAPMGVPIEPDSAGAANTDNLFRYDPVADQYIYNLDTSDLSVGTWKAIVHFDDGSEQSVLFGLK